MKDIIARMTGGFSSSARVVDGTLILSMPDALEPVVWRMELGHVRSSAIEVRAQENGTFMLTLKTPKGDVNEIAPYATRARAVAALMAVSRAMENARGAMTRAAAQDHAQAGYGPAPAKGGKAGKFLAGIVGIFLVFALLTLIVANMQVPGNINNAALAPAGGNAPSAAEVTGTAVPADDFLRSR